MSENTDNYDITFAMIDGSTYYASVILSDEVCIDEWIREQEWIYTKDRTIIQRKFVKAYRFSLN